MKILGYDYLIVDGEDYGRVAGSCDVKQAVIHVDPAQTPEMQESTVLHEIIEALAYHLNLMLPPNADEVIMPLEAGLYQVLTAAGVDLSPLLREVQRPRQKRRHCVDRERTKKGTGQR